MAKAQRKPRVIRSVPNEKPLKVNTDFAGVFKTIRKHKENAAKKPE